MDMNEIYSLALAQMIHSECHHGVGRESFEIGNVPEVMIQAVTMHRTVKGAHNHLLNILGFQLFGQINKLLFATSPGFWRCDVEHLH